MQINQLNEKLTQLLGSFSGFAPELALALLFVLLIIMDLIFFKKSQKLLAGIAISGILIIACLTFLQWMQIEQPISLFLGMIQVDRIAVFFKFLFLLSGLLAILLPISDYQKKYVQHLQLNGEYLSLLAAFILGLCLMVMAANLLMLYLTIEVVSICSYILTTFKGDKKGAEGGLKYLLFGAMSSGIMLYGMSLLYGFTGTLQFYQPDFLSGLSNVAYLPLIVAIILTLGGLLFKIAAVPFHIWTPDVYEAAPTPVVAFFSVAPKAAAFVVMLRLFSLQNHQIMPALQAVDFTGLYNLLIAIAILTLTAGNFSALWQNNAKRMLAYSSIAHAGFILTGLLALNELGWQSIVFYITVYLFMNFAAFLLIDIISKESLSEDIRSYKGLGITNPFLGVAFLIVMIALTGLPPTAGFSAKLFVFSALWQSYQSTGYNWLLALFIISLFNVAVALFYYLRIPFFMFLRNRNELKDIKLSMYNKVLIVLLIIPLFVFFLKADWLMNIIGAINFK